MQYSAVQYNAVQYSAVQYITVQESTAKYNKVQSDALNCTSIHFLIPTYAFYDEFLSE